MLKFLLVLLEEYAFSWTVLAGLVLQIKFPKFFWEKKIILHKGNGRKVCKETNFLRGGMHRFMRGNETGLAVSAHTRYFSLCVQRYM